MLIRRLAETKNNDIAFFFAQHFSSRFFLHIYYMTLVSSFLQKNKSIGRFTVCEDFWRLN